MVNIKPQNGVIDSSPLTFSRIFLVLLIVTVFAFLCSCRKLQNWGFFVIRIGRCHNRILRC